MRDDDDDDDEPTWRRPSPKTTPGARTTSTTGSSLRSQLTAIADTWERTKLTEQQTLNRRISTLTASNRTLESEKEEAKEEVRELEAKVEAKDKEIASLQEKVDALQTGAGGSNKRLLALQFIIAELVVKWPQLPVYAPPPEGALVVDGESDSGADSDSSDEDDDEGDDETSALQLEGGSAASSPGSGGAPQEPEDLDEDDDDEEDDGDEGSVSVRKKKKKRGKRGGKKKKTSPTSAESSPEKLAAGGSGNDSSWDEVSAAAAADGVALPPPPPPHASSGGGGDLVKAPGAELAEQDQRAKRKAKRGKRPKRSRKPRYLLPQISHHERAPFPSDLVVPSNLVTREDFMALTGGSGLTRKQLNSLEGLLGGLDGTSTSSAGNGDSWLSTNTEEAMLGMVDEVLGGGLNACCGANGSLRVAKLLLSSGANPSYMGQEFDASPVHRAIQYGHEHVFALLLTHKVNVNATDPHLGRTPLHFAAQYNRPTLAKLLVQKGARVDAVDNSGETATDIATKLKWKKVASILTDPSVLFWNFANRANKLYKAMEYDLAIQVYEKSFAILDEVKPSPSAQNKATLHYNCARAAANLGRHVAALGYCDQALAIVPTYSSAVEQRAKCHIALFNYKLAIADLDTLIGGVTASEPGNLEQWMRLKRDAKERVDQSHFSLLGLEASGAGVSAADVKKAYRTQCIAWHPDKHVSSDEAKHRAHLMFQRVNEANEVLSDPLKKQQYEYQLRFRRPATTAASSPSSSWGYNATHRTSTAGSWGYGKHSGFEDSDEDDDDDEDGNL